MYYPILSTKYARRLETDLLEGRRATPDLSKRHAAAAGAHVHKNRHTIKQYQAWVSKPKHSMQRNPSESNLFAPWPFGLFGHPSSWIASELRWQCLSFWASAWQGQKQWLETWWWAILSCIQCQIENRDPLAHAQKFKVCIWHMHATNPLWMLMCMSYEYAAAKTEPKLWDCIIGADGWWNCLSVRTPELPKKCSHAANANFYQLLLHGHGQQKLQPSHTEARDTFRGCRSILDSAMKWVRSVITLKLKMVNSTNC